MTQDLFDLHCHILPRIDDGAKNVGASMELLRQEIEGGAAGVCLTPHFHYERTTVEEFDSKRQSAFRTLAEQVEKEQLNISLKMGAEVYYTPALPSLDLKKLAFEGSDYILIEFPTTHHPTGIEDTLFEIEQMGYTPILAHIERYPFVAEDPTILYNWVQGGAIAQVNAASLVRGGRTAARIKKYIKWNLVHLIGSDAHSPDRRPVNLHEGMKALPEKMSARFKQNAADVFSGEPLSESLEPVEPKFRFGNWR